MMNRWLTPTCWGAWALIWILVPASPAAEPLRVPAFTAYVDDESAGVRISSRSGVTGWTNPAVDVRWFGQLRATGTLDAAIALRLPSNRVSRLRLALAGQTREAEVRGLGTNEVLARFGPFSIGATGYQAFTLTSLNPPGHAAGNPEALLLSGPATANAHFNLKPRRNAASVHLGYPNLTGTNLAAFYCEATGIDEPVATYYMACGWHRGYFGMQVNSRTERRIIFSVWDSGNEAISRAKVADENRVTLVAKGEGVYSGDFGNEGTGGHSHLKYPWKTGERQRFLVTAQPTNGTFTVYAGYWFHPEKQAWMLISSWRAPKDGSWLRGLYSFSENFGGGNGHLRRKALFGNQWVRTSDGRWVEVTTARFSHDATGKEDRLDRFMGVEGGQFFLCHGGFGPGFTRSGDRFERPPAGPLPAILQLPLPSLSPTRP
ncbi:MAG: hypothetical protein RJA22_2603 [Verrucomicrobiota bacterium]|jgi:hypothetical protein